MNKFFKIFTCLSVISIFCSLCICFENTDALSSLEQTRERAYLQAIDTCFRLKTTGVETIKEYPYDSVTKYTPSERQVPETLTNYGGIEWFAPYKNTADSATFKALWPTGLTEEYTNGKKENSDSATSCANYIWRKRDGFTQNIWERYGVEEPKPDSSNLEALMANVGYKKSENKTMGKCFVVKYSWITYNNYTTGSGGDVAHNESTGETEEGTSYLDKMYCANTNSDGRMVSEVFDERDIDRTRYGDASGQVESDKDERGVSFVFNNESVYSESSMGFRTIWSNAGDISFAGINPAPYPWQTFGASSDEKQRCNNTPFPTDGYCIRYNQVYWYYDGDNRHVDNYYYWSDVLADIRAKVAKIQLGTISGGDLGIDDGHDGERPYGNACAPGGVHTGHINTRYTCYYNIQIITDDENRNDWVMSNTREKTAETAWRYFKEHSSIKNFNSIRIGDSDAVVLYQYYIARIAGFKVNCNDSMPEGSTAIKWFTAPDKREDCWIVGAPPSSGTQYSLIMESGSEHGYFTKQGPLSEVIERLNAIDKSRLTAVTDEDLAEANEGGVVVPDGDSGDGEEEKVAPTCSNSAGALGWLLCPIMEGAADAMNGAYTNFIEPSLRIEPKLFSGDVETVKAWGYFRDIANIAIVGFLLVIIFSQVTGFGIDNYGIKKSLPKLIAAAVMTNASYILSELVVDLSNIVGTGVTNVFKTLEMNTGFSTSQIAGASFSIGADVFLPIVLVTVLVAGIGTLIAAVSANGIAIILPIFLCVLGLGISIITLFTILAIRQAGVLVLVVASPLAFLCYALPNTKRIFSKWLNALKALLLLYPICSALVGGGSFVSRLILSTGGANASFFLALTAMIVGAAPIFFIPSLLKSSLAALGNVGMKASNFGRSLSSRSRRRIEGSNLAKGVKGIGQMQGQKNQYRKAQKTLSKYAGRDPRSLGAGKLSKIASAQGVVSSHEKTMKGLYGTQYKGMSQAQLMDSMSNIRMDAMTSGKGVDAIPAVAALEELSGRDAGLFMEQYMALSDTAGFQDLMKNDSSSRGKVVEMLAAQKGNPFASTAAKQLSKMTSSNDLGDFSMRNMMMRPEFREKIRGKGVGAMRDIDKDVLKTAAKDSNMSRMFSSEQIRAGMMAGYDNDTQAAFQSVLEQRAKTIDPTDGKSLLEKDVSDMSADQIIRSDSGSLATIAGGQYADPSGEMHNMADWLDSNAMASVIAKGASGENAAMIGNVLEKRGNVGDLSTMSSAQLASASPEFVEKVKQGMLAKAEAEAVIAGHSGADARAVAEAKVNESLKSALSGKWQEINSNQNLKGRVDPKLATILGAGAWGP